MAILYGDENFSLPVVKELRKLGYEVLTAQEAGKAGKKIDDPEVLAYGIQLGRAVLTFDRTHFRKLHRRVRPHHGIIICTRDEDHSALAMRIHEAIRACGSLDNQLIRVNRLSEP